MSDIIISEAKRCLQCKKPLCKVGCPVNTPFNEVIKLLLEGSIVDAGEMLFNNNPLSDVARTAIRNGSREVSIMYRKGPVSMDAETIEVDYAKLDGVKFNFYQSPLEILDSGVKYIKTQVNGVEEGGKEIVETIEGSENILECDSVILAVGQKPRTNIVSNSKGIDVNHRGLLVTDESGRTTREGVFASGDVVTGAKTVVEAVRVSKIVAAAIEEYIMKNE